VVPASASRWWSPGRSSRTETAKAKACGPDDLDCINSLGVEEGSEETQVVESTTLQQPAIEVNSIVRDQSGAGAQTESEVYVPEMSVVEDRQIIENEVRTQITVEQDAT